MTDLSGLERSKEGQQICALSFCPSLSIEFGIDRLRLQMRVEAGTRFHPIGP